MDLFGIMSQSHLILLGYGEFCVGHLGEMNSLFYGSLSYKYCYPSILIMDLYCNSFEFGCWPGLIESVV